MNKIGICGHFGFDKKLLNGQTIKTKILYKELVNLYGEADVKTLDTHAWLNAPFKLLWNILQLTKDCCHIIILPASNGIKVFAPLFALFSKSHNVKLHYMVIGGWLPELLSNNLWLLKSLKQFAGIYVETNSMKQKLNALGLDNIYIVPNFKDLHILKESEFVYSTQPPYKFCTFSRVMKEKGIEEAIESIIRINEENHEVLCYLDIYGQIDANYKNAFKKIISKVPNYINYKGEVPFAESVNVLKEYYALLFPTCFFTEGLPGTIIDAYAAGLPIIASGWENAKEFIEVGKTGLIFEMDNNNDFKLKILNSIENEELFLRMKINCINRAEHYIPKTAIKTLTNNLDYNMKG